MGQQWTLTKLLQASNSLKLSHCLQSTVRNCSLCTKQMLLPTKTASVPTCVSATVHKESLMMCSVMVSLYIGNKPMNVTLHNIKKIFFWFWIKILYNNEICHLQKKKSRFICMSSKFYYMSSQWSAHFIPVVWVH